MIEQHRIEIKSDGCIANISIDGVQLRGVTEVSVDYGVNKLPMVRLGIAAPNLLVRGCEVDYRLSDLLILEVEEAKKLMELSANSSIAQD